MNKTLALSIITVTLAGCASGPSTKWAKEGSTEQDYGRDYSECLALAHGSSGGYPTTEEASIYQPPQPGGGFTSGFNSGMAMAASMSAARDRGARRGAIAAIQHNCMIGRGWIKTPVESD